MPGPPGETEEQRAERKKKEREEYEKKKKEREKRPPETEEERAERKKREKEEYERRKAKEGGHKETEEERAERKRKEREEYEKRKKEREPETEEQRAERKKREKEEYEKKKRRETETEEQRAERKKREKEEYEKRKKEKESGGDHKERKPETEEERAERKKKEREEYERRKRKEKEEKEKAEGGGEKHKETEEERAERKKKERAEYERRKAEKEGGNRSNREKETEEERKERKERERKERERDERKKREKEKAAPKQEEEEDEYGDDFENAYEEDFEDDIEADDEDDGSDSPKVSELKKAMDREKQEMQRRERADKEKEKKKHRKDSESHSKSDGPKRMDPKKSKHLRKLKEAYIKRYERAQQLSRLVDLEAMTYELADVTPQTEYDLYITNFGHSNATQAATQIPDRDEIEDVHVQTEQIHFKNKELQVPEDFGLFPRPTGLIKQETSKRKDNIEQLKIDTMGLSSYLHRTYPVFRVLLDESEIAETSGSTPSKTEFSTSFVSMYCLPLLTGRRIEDVAFSAVTPQYLVCVHSATKVKAPIGVNPDEDVSHLDGILTVWNVNNPHVPDKLLVANASLACACFSPTKGFLVYCGGKDGSVYLWDLREPDYTHNNSLHQTPNYNYRKKKRKGGELNLTTRFPSYSTDWLAGENHNAPIVKLLPMGYNAKVPPSSDTDVTEQIATLDCEGNVMFWVVVELQQRDTEIAETDLGLNIFSKVKLVKSAATRLNNPQKFMVPHLMTHEKQDEEYKTESPSKRGTSKINDQGMLLSNITTCYLECVPDDPTQFLVGTSTGYIIHSSRFGQNASPALYHSAAPNPFLEPRSRAQSLAVARDIKFGTQVLSIHYSPTDPDYFIAGFEDGTVSLYKTTDNTPAFTFSTFTQHGCVCVRWSNHHKGLFFVLDSSGEVFVFDLMRERADQRLVPICRSNAVVVVKTDDGKEKRTLPTTLELSHEKKETVCKLAIAYDDGHVDLHALKPDLVQPEGQRSYAFFSQLT